MPATKHIIHKAVKKLGDVGIISPNPIMRAPQPSLYRYLGKLIHISLTWIKFGQKRGWFPLLRIIPSEGEQWGRCNLLRCIIHWLIPTMVYFPTIGYNYDSQASGGLRLRSWWNFPSDFRYTTVAPESWWNHVTRPGKHSELERSTIFNMGKSTN